MMFTRRMTELCFRDALVAASVFLSDKHEQSSMTVPREHARVDTRNTCEDIWACVCC